MAVNWYWKHKKGEILFKDVKHNVNWKLELFGGNMMCAFIYRYTKVNEETHKREKWYNFFTWFNDIKHAKRVLKNTQLEDLALGNHKVIKVRLLVHNDQYSAFENNEMLELAKILAKMNYKVEIYAKSKTIRK